MRPLHSGVLLAVTLASSASIRAQTAKLTMSGIVTDKVSLKPVEAATVSVVGNLANQELTDGGGFFILSFSGSAHEGEAVRVHVEKTGYSVYDAWKSISSTISLKISLEPITSRPRIKL